MSTQPPHSSFGRALRERRLELGLTIDDVAAQDGPSTSSLNRLEHGKVTVPHRKTLEALDRILKWEEGTTKSLFAQSYAPESHAASHPADLRIFEDEIVELVTWNNLLARHHQDTEDSTAKAYTERITTITNALLARWIDTKIQENDVVALRFLTNVIANQPLGSPEDDDHNDQLYRRWRLGLIPDEQLTEEQRVDFSDKRSRRL